MRKGRPPLTDEQREKAEVERKRRIQNAGAEIFTQQGYYLTTVDLIAAEAKVSKRTFYEFYRSKSDLLIDILLFPKEKIIQTPPQGSALTLASLSTAFFVHEQSFRHFQLVKVAWEGRRELPEFEEAFGRATRTLSTWLKNVLDIRLGVDPDVLAVVALNIVYGGWPSVAKKDTAEYATKAFECLSKILSELKRV